MDESAEKENRRRRKKTQETSMHCKNKMQKITHAI